jgi:Flp pilus assembly protein TadD
LALALARKICEPSRPANADYLDTLAAALAENGRFEEAAAVAAQALSQAVLEEPGPQTANLVKSVEKRLALYKAKQPFRDAPGRAGKWALLVVPREDGKPK